MKININDAHLLTDTQKEFLESIIHGAMKNYSNDKYLAPFAFLHSSETNTMQMVAASFTNEKEKDMFAIAVRTLVQKRGVDSILFLSESWTIPKDKTEDFMANRDKYPSVSAYPHRQDCIMISYETKNGAWLGTIIVDDESKTVLSDEIEVIGAHASSGRFTNFLK